MIDLIITVEGQLVRMGLQNLAAQVPQVGRQQIYFTVLHIRTRMRQGYIQAPATQSYKRSYALWRAWQIERAGEGYRIWADPRTARGKPYAHYVVGDAEGQGQAWMHMGNWPVFREVVDEEVKKLPEEIEQRIEITAKSLGF